MVAPPSPFAYIIKKIGEENWSLLNDKTWLYDQYVEQNKSSRDIASFLGCGKKSVLASLKRLGIDISKPGRNKSNRSGVASHFRQMPESAVGKVDNEEWLNDKYIAKNKTMVEISEMVGVSKTCVKRWVNKFNIKKEDCDLVKSCSRRYEEKNGFKWDSDEARRHRFNGIKSETVKTKKGSIVRCHSGWEKTVASRLDKDTMVESFGKDTIKLKYEFGGKIRTYIVDFYIVLNDGREFLVEVKAPRFLNDDMVKAKIDALENSDFEYFVITNPNQEFAW